MSLDENYSRRLETLIARTEEALDRIAQLLETADTSSGSSVFPTASVREAGEMIQEMRRRLATAAQNFGLPRRRLPPRQILSGELSALWVALENSLPQRMKGYGRELSTKDRVEWEGLVRSLIDGVENLNRILVRPKERRMPRAKPEI